MLVISEKDFIKKFKENEKYSNYFSDEGLKVMYKYLFSMIKDFGFMEGCDSPILDIDYLVSIFKEYLLSDITLFFGYSSTEELKRTDTVLEVGDTSFIVKKYKKMEFLK